MKTKPIFCAHCQDTRDQEVKVVLEKKEIITTCPECKREIKFPYPITISEFEGLIAQHKTANEGHDVITPEKLAAQKVEEQAANDFLESL